jgi:hypothetical protein
MHGEAGASLVIALGFLVMFGLLIPAIVSLGGNNLIGTVRLQDQRADVYTADGALDGAVQYLRQPANGSCGRPNAAVCSYTTTLNGKTATVTMDAKGGLFELDRTIDLAATVNGKTAHATVIIRDSESGAVGETLPPGCTVIPCVDVELWQSLR